MDFLRLSRSRSGTSANKKRSPLPSPAGRQSSGGLDQAVSSIASHASDHAAQREGAKTTSPSASSKEVSASHSVAIAQAQQHESSPQPVACTFPSLLSPPNPAFVSGSEARGILINARRPSVAAPFDNDGGTVQTRSANSPLAATVGPPATKQTHNSFGSSPLAPRPAHLRSSVSSDSMLCSSRNASNDPAIPIDQHGRARIRFAPLPDPRRPRSHSTGRDIWFDEDSENHVHINTRDGTEVTPSSWSSSGSGGAGLGAMNGSSAQSNSLSVSLGDDMDDEYSTSPGSRGVSHKRTSNTLSKLLQPLKLGRSKSRESDKLNSPDSDVNRLSLSASPSTSLSHWMNGGEPLSRSISTGAGSADIERQRKEEFRPSGVPLKKSSTQESNKSYRNQQPVRRILYPSVAQGGVRTRDIRRAAPVVEPEFVEWTNPSARSGMNTTQQEDDDDGSGMAWLKKRRAEREKKAKEEAEAAATATANNTNREGRSESDVLDYVTQPHQKSLKTETVTVAMPDGNNAVPNITIGNSEDPATAGIKAYPAHDQVEAEETEEKEVIADRSSDQAAPPEEAIEDSDEDDSDSATGEDDAEDDNVDDLSDTEIEEEERLAEEARRTTGGASRELYHSHGHQASTYTFEAPPLQRRPSSRSNSLNIPPSFERQLSYSSLSIQQDIPRSVATSHPGDWPLREQVVPPC